MMRDWQERPGGNADRTLVSWFSFDEPVPETCSVLTIQTDTSFDAIALGAGVAGRWSVASEEMRRTQALDAQAANPIETITPGRMHQIAVVCQDNRVTIYRDAAVYTTYEVEATIDLLSSPYLKVVVGPVQLADHASKSFTGSVDDIRIYAQALTVEQLAALEPNLRGELRPLAWWDFEPGREMADRCGCFPEARHDRQSRVEGGALVLGSANSYFWTVDTAAVRTVRRFRETLMVDASRPTYHLINSEGDNDRLYPTDPNIAIYWRGKYHLSHMHNGDAPGWAHFSSIDLLHWRREPTSCPPGLSGGCFVNAKGEVTFVTRDGLAFSSHDNLEEWSDWHRIRVIDEPGRSPREIEPWDPTGWFDGNSYYLLAGVRPRAGEERDLTLLESSDLETWNVVGSFMEETMPDVQPFEDYSCSELFELGGRHVWLLISHQLGCRYYIGELRDKRFVAESHGRMNWNSYRLSNLFKAPEFFAPRTLLTPDGRRVMFAWLPGGGNTLWSGTFSLPRELSLPEDGVLRIRPVRELERLRYNDSGETQVTVNEGESFTLGIAGDTLELCVTFTVADRPAVYEVRVLCDDHGSGLSIAYDAAAATLSVGSEEMPDPITESGAYTVAPLSLEPGEDLTLRIFIDRPLVEVFANERQAVYRRYPHSPDATGVCLFCHGSGAEVRVRSWEMAASNQW